MVNTLYYNVDKIYIILVARCFFFVDTYNVRAAATLLSDQWSGQKNCMYVELST